MKRIVICATLAGALTGMFSGLAMAAVSHTQHLPVAACNAGTLNAHDNIPPTTGTGAVTPGHMAVPGTAFVMPCGHGG